MTIGFQPREISRGFYMDSSSFSVSLIARIYKLVTPHTFTPAAMMKRSLILLLLFLMIHPLMAHYKAKFHVLVDTDGGPGDMRALCMMLADPEIEVIAVTAVNGTLPADQTIQQVLLLMRTFGHEGIPVGGSSHPEAVEMILHEVELEEMPVDLVALGPLNNLSATFAERPSLYDQVRTLYWVPEETEETLLDSNNVSSSLKLFKESGFHTEVIGGSHQPFPDIQSFREEFRKVDSRYARATAGLAGQFSSNGMSAEVLRIREELVPLLMKFPLQFEQLPMASGGHIDVRRLHPDAPVNRMILEMLDGEAQDRSIVLSCFPTDTSWYAPDVSATSSEIIKRHGEKEWRLLVLTNEFHEHLGIYSILGAKMGLRAREYFNVGIDELDIHSFAGSTPPLSCMNDGLQVSTGATLGHGTIKVTGNTPFPRATFRFKDRQVTLTVKEEFRTRIRDEVKHGVETYGLDSDAYWEYIRSLALNYWLAYSRFEIFDLE
jgi:pyrimidine-specific ribonucleoside hydrolase